MNYHDVTNELARLRAANPNSPASFLADRAARIAELEAKLATMTPPHVEDPAYLAMLARADASSPANRAAARWR
jgi:hypothetical protein